MSTARKRISPGNAGIHWINDIKLVSRLIGHVDLPGDRVIANVPDLPAGAEAGEKPRATRIDHAHRRTEFVGYEYSAIIGIPGDAIGENAARQARDLPQIVGVHNCDRAAAR